MKKGDEGSCTRCILRHPDMAGLVGKNLTPEKQEEAIRARILTRVISNRLDPIHVNDYETLIQKLADSLTEARNELSLLRQKQEKG